MMRTVEALLAIILLFSALVGALAFAVLPTPRSVSNAALRDLASSTLQTLDSQGFLTQTAFGSPGSPQWLSLQAALASVLPPSVLYNLTVFDVSADPSGFSSYNLVGKMTNSPSNLGSSSEAASIFVTSPNVTFTVTPQRIPHTLYILDAADANGWWITGYTAQTLASDLFSLLSPFFTKTILINSTTQLGTVLNGTSLLGETVPQAVIIDTFGEAVPVPAGYYTTTGYDSSHNSYALYDYNVGKRVNQYNWTWVSIVGYPMYYVSNTVTFATSQNTWGIYGMLSVGPAGLNAFLEGIDNQAYSYNGNWIAGSPGVVTFSSSALYNENYYGVYPSPSQTSTRALPTSIEAQYHLIVPASNGFVFNPANDFLAGATYQHKNGGSVQGVFTAIGLTRTPDIRVTELAILMFYAPTLFRASFTASGTSRLVVLQLSYQGGG